MKIGIIGDTHFGAAYNLGKTDPNTQLNSRLLDFSNTFNGIVDRFIDRGVKLIILTGDIFESRHPSSAQLNTFSNCLRRIIDNDIEVIIVAGNHDQQRNIDTTTIDIYGLLNLSNVSVYPKIGTQKVKISQNEDLNIILMPYRDRRMVNAPTNADAIQITKEELDNVTKQIKGKKLLVGHMMMEKTFGDDNPDGFSINELILPMDMFSDIDLTIMGHIHRHDIVSKEPHIIYSGSMEKVSFGEREHQKVSLIVDTDDMSVEIIKTPTRNLIEIPIDYSNDKKPHKAKINEKLQSDIDTFSDEVDITNAIVRLVAKIHDIDLYHVNQQKIREHLLSKGIHNLTNIQISAVKTRQLRNSEITEDVSEKKAMVSFIESLNEPDNIKKKLQKNAASIIEEVGGE